MSQRAIRASTLSMSAEPIDLDHLRAQTCGDAALEADLLDLFSRQARTILRDLAATAASAAERRDADLLHTLCGSARVVGAWEVATGAEQLERIKRREGADRPTDPRPSEPDGLIDALDGAVERACQAIETLRAVAAEGAPETSTRR